MTNTNLKNKIINLQDLEEDKKYNLNIQLRTASVVMEDLNPSEIHHEINSLCINCAFLQYSLIYFITEPNQKTYKL